LGQTWETFSEGKGVLCLSSAAGRLLALWQGDFAAALSHRGRAGGLGVKQLGSEKKNAFFSLKNGAVFN